MKNLTNFRLDEFTLVQLEELRFSCSRSKADIIQLAISNFLSEFRKEGNTFLIQSDFRFDNSKTYWKKYLKSATTNSGQKFV